MIVARRVDDGQEYEWNGRKGMAITMTRRRGSQRAGFTLIELLVVTVIIGIIISAILVAASDGVRRAEEKATQGLITKLDFAMNDRVDALFNAQAPINQSHRYLAAINYGPSGGPYIPIPSSIERRAQVIAQSDYIRSELPDVFYRNSQTSDGGTVATTYPLNFAAVPYPTTSNAIGSFLLPLGQIYTGIDSKGAPFMPPASGLNDRTGIFGASFAAAGGIYKNLGYRPQGYDGVDNTGNGYVDEIGESGTTFAAVEAKLAKHTHKTARAEMLYAILVEGLGPLGSTYQREDFTDREVRDTDGDGLPEFVDAWGEPLQFYRWPIYYGTVTGSSDSQIGTSPYSSASQVRQQDPLDPNQLLVAPGWWYNAANLGLPGATAPIFSRPNTMGTNTSSKMSQGAIAFSIYFRSLVDPSTAPTWDRSAGLNRRAYFSKFLILSSGPDKEPGVGQYNKNYANLVDNSTGVASLTFPVVGKSMAVNSQYLTLIENQAAQEDPFPITETPNPASARTGSFFEIVPGAGGSKVSAYLQTIAGTDDITNQNISAPGTGVR